MTMDDTVETSIGAGYEVDGAGRRKIGVAYLVLCSQKDR